MKSRRILALSWLLAAVLGLCGAGVAVAQEPGASGKTIATKDPAQGAPTEASLKLTLQDALARARKNSVQFQSALTDSAIARQDLYQAGTALFPSVNYNTQALYTQSNGPGNGVRYIANNAVHEYISQANVHESLDLAGVSNFRRASALAAAAKARAEIASRKFDTPAKSRDSCTLAWLM